MTTHKLALSRSMIRSGLLTSIFLLTIGVFLYAAPVQAAFDTCIEVTRNLSFGSRDANTGGQVSMVQAFLAQDSDIYPEGEVTGYFGRLTERAVQRFQQRYDIVSYGGPDSTGYGVVGPRTRAFMAAVCEDDDDGSRMTIDDIDDIRVLINEADDSAEVEVRLEDGDELSFDIDYRSKTKAVRSIGNELEDRYDFDFDEFSTTKRRDAKLNTLIEWEYEEDGDLRTIDDIRDITVTSYGDGGDADVLVDLREESDLRFTIDEDDQDDMVAEIAEQLEDRYDFDFDEFSSDRSRDAAIEDLIDWEEDERDSYTLNDVSAVTSQQVDPIPNAIDDEYTLYVITLKNGTKHEVKRGFAPTGTFEAAVRATGYTGDINALIAKATVVKSSYTIEHVKTITKSVSAANVWPVATVYTITLVNGAAKITVTTYSNYTTAERDAAFRASGYIGDIAALIAKTSTVATTAYGLVDVASVTSQQVDPIPNAIDDEYTLYVITLKTGTKREVKVNGNADSSMRTAAFRASGYTGDITALIAKATVVKSAYTLAHVKTITKSVSAANVWPIVTTYTITLVNGASKITVVTNSSQTTAERDAAFRASGYTGDVAALIAKVGNTSDSGKSSTFGVDDITSVVMSIEYNNYPGASGPELYGGYVSYYSVYQVTLDSGEVRTAKVQSYGAETFNSALAKIGYVGDYMEFLAKVSQVKNNSAR